MTGQKNSGFRTLKPWVNDAYTEYATMKNAEAGLFAKPSRGSFQFFRI